MTTWDESDPPNLYAKAPPRPVSCFRCGALHELYGHAPRCPDEERRLAAMDAVAAIGTTGVLVMWSFRRGPGESTAYTARAITSIGRSWTGSGPSAGAAADDVLRLVREDDDVRRRCTT